MKKIVLVDDMEIFTFIMKKLITNVNPLHEVHDFTDGNQALNQIEELNPDIIFLDLNMPLINGWEFLNKMKERQLSNKVYILTSSTSATDLQRSADYENVIHFLIKPLNKNQIAEILTFI